jgi:WD40 repeat protein
MSIMVLNFFCLAALCIIDNSPPPVRLRDQSRVVGAELSPDGRNLASITENGAHRELVDLVVWDVPSSSKTALLKGIDSTRVFGFSNDSTILAFPDSQTNTVHLWKRDAACKWNVLKVFNVGAGLPKPNMPASAFSSGATNVFVSIATASSSLWTVEEWDVITGRRVPFPIEPFKNEFPVGVFVLVSSDGMTLCLMTTEGTVGVDAVSGRRKYAIQPGLSLVAVSPDGRVGAAISPSIATAAGPKEVTFWNFGDGTQRRHVTTPSGEPTGMFTADSRFFVIPDDFGIVRVIDVKKAVVCPSWKVGRSLGRLFLLTSGEIASVRTEGKAVVIWKMATREISEHITAYRQGRE